MFLLLRTFSPFPSEIWRVFGGAEVAAVRPGRSVYQVDQNNRPTLVWKPLEGPVSPGSPSSTGPSQDGGPSHIVLRPTPINVQSNRAWKAFATFVDHKETGIRSTAEATVPSPQSSLAPLLLPAFSAPAASPLKGHGTVSHTTFEGGAGFRTLKRQGTFPVKGSSGECNHDQRMS